MFCICPEMLERHLPRPGPTGILPIRSRSQEVPMTNRVRVNLANARELLELVGISENEVETIVRFRAEHGPIADGQQLSAVPGGRPTTAATPHGGEFAASAA